MRNPGGDDDRSDAVLLAAHAAGDRDAFSQLFVRHRSRLYRLARRWTQNDEDAADAVQDAMLAAYRTGTRFRREAAVASWLQRIVINVCLDRLRRNATRTPVALEDRGSPGSDRAGTPTSPDHSSRVEARVQVRQALLALPVGQRAAVLAVDMQGHSVLEAAQLLGVAEGTVKSRRARAHRRLSRQLRHLGPPVGAH